MKRDDNTIVYKTFYGAKMHIRKNCPSIINSKIEQITVKNGKELGLNFCKVCGQEDQIKLDSLPFQTIENKKSKKKNTHKENILEKINNQNNFSQNSDKSISKVIPDELSINTLSIENEKSISFTQLNYLQNENNNVNGTISSAFSEGMDYLKHENKFKEEQKNKSPLKAKEKNNLPKKEDKCDFIDNSVDDRVLTEIVESLDETKLSNISINSSLIKINLLSTISVYSEESDFNFDNANAVDCADNKKFYYCINAKAKKENKKPIRLCIGYSILNISEPQEEGNFLVERYFYCLKLDKVNRVLYIIIDFENKKFKLNEKEGDSMKQIYKKKIYIDSYISKKILPYIAMNQFDKAEIVPYKED